MSRRTMESDLYLKKMGFVFFFIGNLTSDAPNSLSSSSFHQIASSNNPRLLM